MTDQTFFTIKTPDGKLLPLFLARDESESVQNYTMTTNAYPIACYAWKMRQKDGYTVVPVKVRIEEINP